MEEVHADRSRIKQFYFDSFQFFKCICNFLNPLVREICSFFDWSKRMLLLLLPGGLVGPPFSSPFYGRATIRAAASLHVTYLCRCHFSFRRLNDSFLILFLDGRHRDARHVSMQRPPHALAGEKERTISGWLILTYISSHALDCSFHCLILDCLFDELASEIRTNRSCRSEKCSSTPCIKWLSRWEGKWFRVIHRRCDFSR